MDKHLRFSALLLILFVVGCSANQQPAKIDVPDIFKIRAQRQEWEYKTFWVTNLDPESSPFGDPPCGYPGMFESCIAEDSSSKLAEYLNQLGADGWELVTIVQIDAGDHAIYTFKRPVE